MSPDEGRLKSLLIEGLDGDQAAYRRFLLELGQVLRGYVRGQLTQLNRADLDTDDIVQEAMLAIHNRRHTYDRIVPVTAWARAIARYKLIDYLRSSARYAHHRPLNENIIGDDGSRIQMAIDVRKVIGMLPRQVSRSIQLTKIEGRSVTETAAEIRASESAIKTNVHRGLKAMKRILKGS